MILRAALAFLLLAAPAPAHEITFSRVELRLSAGGTEVAATLPVLALLHELAETNASPLPPGTTEEALRAEPLAPALRDALARLLEERLRLEAGGAALPLDVTTVAAAGDDVSLRATAPRARGALAGEADLFPDDPLHRAFVDVWRDGALAGQFALGSGDAAFALEAPARAPAAVALDFLREGFGHVLGGADHLLFVLALVVLGGGWRAQAGIVTAFTAGHAVTLTLASLGLVAPPAALVERGVALGLVAVGAWDLWVLRRGPGRDLRPALALGFGLVHGFAFAAVLRADDLPAGALAAALAAFNVGVEGGQLLVVLAAAPALAELRRAAPRGARGAAAGVAAAAAATGAAGLWAA